MSKVSLHPQQKEAFNWAITFINSKELEATLSGSAGTGKTFLLKYLVHKITVPFCITAPVHKALRVLEETVNRKGRTFHSLHGLRPNVDLATFDLDNVQFDPIGEPYAQYYKLIICDECSQISKSLYNLNLERARKYGYKILYVGDDAQLPPVTKKKGSNSYERESPTFSVKNRFHLTDIVRQEKGNPLLEPFDLLRKDIKLKTTNFRKHIFYNRNTISEGEGYAILNENEFKYKLSEIYNSDAFKSNPNYARNIAYTNNAVSTWNKVIRKIRLPNSINLLSEGDLLMAYTTVVDEFNEPKFVNSETYLIEYVRDYINDYDIKVFAVNLVNNDTSLPTTTLQIVDHSHKSWIRYYNILSQLHLRAKQSHQGERSRSWKKFFEFKNEFLSLITFKLPAENNYQVISKDFDYGYSITAHKAQGSTFDIATIDLSDMLFYTDAYLNKKKYPNVDLTNKLIYVSMTRVKNKVYMLL